MNKNLNLNWSTSFINWFIGFSEGDGSLFYHGSYLTFEISQHIKDVQILYYIKSQLGFGKVKLPQQRPNIAIFIITKKDQIDIILKLLKKNLCTQHFVAIGDVEIQKPTLKDSWLSGFIDAEGCFRIKFELNNTIKLIFEISQKEKLILEQIKLLFPSLKGNLRQDREHWVLSFSQQQARKQLTVYLNQHPLKSHKNIVYTKWLKANRIMEKGGHLEEDGKQQILNLSIDLNKWRDL
jgi:hypothetical protein